MNEAQHRTQAIDVKRQAEAQMDHVVVVHVTLTRSHDAIMLMVELPIVSGSCAIDNSLLPAFSLATHVLVLSHL
jgi:hypothetical protein